MANLYHDKTINYRIYKDGSNLLGVGTIDLPELAYMTDTLSGAGVAGEIETPVLGHFQAMSCTINWRTVNNEALALLLAEGATLTLRAAQQDMDGATNALLAKPLKIVIKALPKTVSLGSLEPGATTGTSSELEVSYIKIEEDNKEILEIDKINFICKINGKDTMTDVRSALGL